MKYLIALLSLAMGKFYFVPTTYYVTPSGSGSGTGLDSNNTLSYAALYPKSLAWGDVVKFKAGNTYNGQHYPKDGVLYDRYSAGSNPLISGFTTLTTWANSSGNIYYATLATTPRGVSVDGVIKGPGRYPNTGYLTYTSHSGNTSISGTTVSSLPNSFVGGEVVIKKYRYILDRHIITGRSGSTLSFTSTNFYGNSSSYEPTDNNGYFIQNHLAALDQDGEWAYDASTSRLYMYFAGGPSGRVVKASTITDLIACNSTVGATFQNIDLEGATSAINNNGTSNITVNNVNIRQCGFGVFADASNNITINGGTVSDCWSNGILMDGGTHNSSIVGVKVSNTALIPGMGQSGDNRYNGIGIYGLKARVANCEVRSSGFNGIGYIGDSMLVENNFVDSFCIVKDDGGGLYCFSPNNVNQTSSIIRNNVVLHAIGNAEGAGNNGDPNGEAAAIYLDGYTNHTQATGNFCAVGPWMGVFVNANSYNEISNNKTFDFAMGLAVNQVATSGAGSVRGMTVTGNKFIARTASQLALFVNIINTPDSVSNFGTFNNNLYGRPIDDNRTLQLARSYANGVTSIVSLAGWKTMTGLDAASSKSAVIASSLSDLSFRYNPTTSTVSNSLAGVYKNVLNSSFPGSLSLAPYTGEVLIYNSPLAIQTPGSLIIRGRKVDVINVP